MVSLDETLHQRLQIPLKRLGIGQVSQVATGVEGVRQASLDRPDAVLLDLDLPQSDRDWVLDQLQANPNTQAIPILLLVSKLEQFEMELLGRLEVLAALMKPFNVTTLLMILGWDVPECTVESALHETYLLDDLPTVDFELEIRLKRWHQLV